MDTWGKTSAWALAAAAVLTAMHLADELWTRWDIAASQISSGFEAALMVAGMLVIAFAAFAGILLERRWGSVLGVVFGLYAMWPPLTHFVSTSGMTTSRWAVEVLAALSGIVLVVAAGRELMLLRPATKAKPAGL